MHAYLHCLSHSPLVGYVDPAQAVLDEVNGVIASARARIAAFDPELVVLFAPDHYNGFFYDVMPRPHRCEARPDGANQHGHTGHCGDQRKGGCPAGTDEHTHPHGRA